MRPPALLRADGVELREAAQVEAPIGNRGRRGELVGQVVLRERVPIVRERSGGLDPGKTKDFRLPFDTIPESWNQTMPQMVIAQVVFE